MSFPLIGLTIEHLPKTTMLAVEPIRLKFRYLAASVMYNTFGTPDEFYSRIITFRVVKL